MSVGGDILQTADSYWTSGRFNSTKPFLKIVFWHTRILRAHKEATDATNSPSSHSARGKDRTQATRRCPKN
jgi:hypothetical protein